LVVTIDFTGLKNYTKRQWLGTTAEDKEHANKNQNEIMYNTVQL
jgi:hypothetical protein